MYCLFCELVLQISEKFLLDVCNSVPPVCSRISAHSLWCNKKNSMFQSSFSFFQDLELSCLASYSRQFSSNLVFNLEKNSLDRNSLQISVISKCNNTGYCKLVESKCLLFCVTTDVYFVCHIWCQISWRCFYTACIWHFLAQLR